EAMALSDRVVVMRDGHIEQDGPAADLYERPRTRFVADFIGASNCLEGKVEPASAGWEFVTSEGLRLPVDAPSAPADPRHFILRPERIRWAEDGPTDVAVNGVLASVTYLGERIRYRVQLEGGPTLVVTHPNLPTRRPIAVGAIVRVGWNRADATTLRGFPGGRGVPAKAEHDSGTAASPGLRAPDPARSPRHPRALRVPNRPDPDDERRRPRSHVGQLQAGARRPDLPAGPLDHRE